ncbi:MAG: aspartate aminotransferase family protein [Asgard group archaeon]|nr:aspartate aminotransferase family protein [Asgard group archaeon]
MSDWLAKEIKQYRNAHGNSLKMWEKAKEQFPAGVSHNIRDFHMTPLNLGPPFIESAKGSKIYDIDGNNYIDYWITHGAAILGHSNEAILTAIREQLTKGNHYGMVNEQAINLADTIIDATPSVEKLRFCTTGTEATMYATRLARAFTKRKTIAKVHGGWHGGNDTLFYFVKQVEKGMESNGLRTQEEANIVSFDYNDIEAFQDIIKKHGKELAAVVMEPVLGAGGAIPPVNDFLKVIRETTQENDILLIFDEIITGFRLSYNSGQGYFNVIPDLTTLGKIVGGGAPIGVIGGREDILEQANLQTNGNVWIGGGTFSANPVSMVAGKATLDELRKDKELYEKLNANGEKIRKEINKILLECDAPAIITGVGSMICMHWFRERLSEIKTSSQVKLNLDSSKINNYQLLTFNRGLLLRGGFGYLSTKHTQEDIEKSLQVVEESIKIIAKNS